MLLKRTDKKGNKYYINAFTGNKVIISLGDPLKREPNATIQQLMNYSKAPNFGSNLKEEKANKQRTIFIGDYKRLLNIRSENRDKNEFILACKRVNVNPWPLIIEKKAIPRKRRKTAVKTQKGLWILIKRIINYLFSI